MLLAQRRSTIFSEELAPASRGRGFAGGDLRQRLSGGRLLRGLRVYMRVTLVYVKLRIVKRIS